ncbi:MAG: cardiolipin synthase ClsB [Casimicrobiaceae bacterium]|nr:cardiolipin synthase ClsB [Casimicrobiaceae bacterium]MCX8098452.1 cardiolipin synthase ClsB [Casimicrobiaceae bacterium]MDW8311164.1 cardiolipin synthase ClsB [Burkholderiales bacterium]
MQSFLPGHRIRLLRNGTEFFPALAEAIDQAEHSIYIETYIFADDPVGRDLAERLMRASARGVDVRVVVDAFGTRPYNTRELARRLRSAGVHFSFYRKELLAVSLKQARLRRLHRKLAIIDGRLAFIGGINLIDDMNTPGHTPPRIDFAVAVEGPLLAAVCDAANRLWRLQRLVQMGGPELPNAPLAARTDAVGTVRAKFVVRDNLRYRHSIERAYRAALRVARDEVVIACAYFLPGRRMRRALLAARARGVRVRLILQRRVEFWLLHHASRALYGQLLAGGIEIIEYEKSFLHAKVAVVDGQWATVGSSNIDPISLLLAREANVVVRDRHFACELRTALEELVREGGRPVTSEGWRVRSHARRALEWLAYGCVRLLMGLIGLREPGDAPGAARPTPSANALPETARLKQRPSGTAQGPRRDA